jgi:Protein of unknown function (DUF2490)
VFSVLSSAARGQEHDEQLWLSAAVSGAVADEISFKLETNQRLSAERGGLYESQYIVAVSVEIAEDVNLTGGVNRTVNVADGSVSSTEWRPRQEIAFPITSLGSGQLRGRFRLDQRFVSNSDNVGHRIRPKLTYTLPLTDSVSIELAHESYFNFNTTDFGQQSGHERMRNSLTLSLPLGKNIKAGLGYLNQYRFNRDATDVMEHALTASLALNF